MFIHDMYEFNDKNDVIAANVRLSYRKSRELEEKSIDLTFTKNEDKDRRKLIVDILAFCLMPNHYHFILRQKVDGGIVKFMKKIGSGYAAYFNIKNKRVGPLFQGSYKAIHITKQEYFDYLLFYVHFNPLDLTGEEWRGENGKDYSKFGNHLDEYLWSSHLDYLGKGRFPSVTNRKFYLKLLNDRGGYEYQVKEWIKSIPEKIKTDDAGIIIEKD
ncbi:MAG: transposase [Oscillospiraceae bacterium]|nr:transposase [Oscillospiraceae bacterium]